MDTLPTKVLAELAKAFERHWVRTFVHIGINSFVTFTVTGIAILFTYVAVSDSCEEDFSKERQEFTKEVSEKSLMIAALQGEIQGYQEVISALSRRGRKRSLGILEATAYDLKGCYPFTDGITSTGLEVADGIFAVNPKKIPYGSILEIKGEGVHKYGIAGDTGGAMRRNPNLVDVYIPVHEEAKEFGRRRVEVSIIEFE